ncbi:MAG: maltose alpha-D-glucosyltransferase [Candidatus Tectomicrobia bacterium]|nr:maltose alpha-D-glucosyltransferase [Candidatus Tectomicrobia bacterium]
MTRKRLDSDPLWFKDAIFYELRVRSFFDSDGDGIGDLRGLTQKLDYLQDLGVTTLWLLPFYPSPLRDDGYDISDYANIHPEVGTLQDFKLFLREAQQRGLRVVTELVLNHTSNEHSWFQRSRQAKPQDRWRDFYVWSDTPEKYKETRVIFQDFEHSNWTWDHVAKAYYWHRFYSHQPDLNFENPRVRQATLQMVDFWLRLGVDGLRLDAVPYLFEQEGTNCENLPPTHAFLQELRRHIDSKFEHRMLLAEANQWPEDAVSYFGSGNECHMAFHFPIMPRLFMAIHMENRFPVIDILEQTPAIPPNAQWALFLRNHDELTLEMVTDEERDYMYRAYALDSQARINLGIRRRLAPLLGNDRKKIELMNGLLFSLPGTPIIYYGDEIGMGDNYFLGDRNGVRTPMQWSADRNAGFSRANPQRLILPVIVDPEYHYETVNVENQQHNPHSLLWWMRRLIALRTRFKAFGRGAIEFLQPQNRKVLTFVRSYQEERILVVANLSRFVQFVELDLSAYRGMVPVELFGGTKFPTVGEPPYLLTLGPHTFYWFSLEEQRNSRLELRGSEAPRASLTLPAGRSLDSLLRGRAREALEEVLAEYVKGCRWYGGKAKEIKKATIRERVGLNQKATTTQLIFLEILYTSGAAETYTLPLALAWGEQAKEVLAGSPKLVIAQVRGGRNAAAVSPREGPPAEPTVLDGVLYEPWSPAAAGLLEAMRRRRTFKGAKGNVTAAPTRAFRRLAGAPGDSLTPVLLRAEQSNTSVVFGERLILKVFRRLGEGVNPDLEIGRFLTEQAGFHGSPPVAGYVEYRVGRGEPITLGILQGFQPHEEDAWAYTLDELQRYQERALAEHYAGKAPGEVAGNFLTLMEAEPPPLAGQVIGAYLEEARRLGQRTAELHLALASGKEQAFAPESFTKLYQRSLYQSMRNLSRQTLQLLRDNLRQLSPDVKRHAQAVLNLEGTLLDSLHQLLAKRLAAKRIRTHGDYHLGQVLYTGGDFIITDFEGEPARTLSERRIKTSPLRDVAGMVRSFHYAAAVSFTTRLGGRGAPASERLPTLAPWLAFWQRWVSAIFLKAYLRGMSGGDLLPQARDEIEMLLRVYLLEKAVYELNYELNNRPDWVEVPLRGILELLSLSTKQAAL